MKNLVLAALLAFVAPANTLAQDVAAVAKFSVWLPSKSWALELPAPGFVVKANEVQADGRRYFLAENEKTRLIISVFLELMKAPAQPSECKRSLEDKVKRDSSLSLNGLKGVAYGEADGMETVEFSMAEVNGVPVNQKNILACLIKDDVFVDVHISKVFFKEADKPEFDALLQSISFEVKKRSGPINRPLTSKKLRRCSKRNCGTCLSTIWPWPTESQTISRIRKRCSLTVFRRIRAIRCFTTTWHASPGKRAMHGAPRRI